MKILHIIFSLRVGGSESMLVDIANEQVSDNDVSVYIINSSYDTNLLEKFDEKIHVHLFNRKQGSRNILKILSINLWVSRIMPDVIHCHDSNIIDLLPIACYFKTVLTVHAIDLPLRGVDKYDSVIAISGAVKDHLIERKIRNVKRIYNGIHLSKIENENKNRISDKFRIVQISRLDHTKKGQHILLEALSILVNKYHFTNFYLDFIGEGDSLSYLQNLVTEYNLDDKVSFLGLVDRTDIYSKLKDYNLLVQPSLFEGFGLTVAEGMAAKVPVLVSANDGPLEIVQGGEYGFCFKRGDAVDCAEQIYKISNLKGVDEVVERAYLHCLNNFDIKKTAENYCKEYKL